MKKTILAAFAALSVLACNSQTLEQKTIQFNEKSEAIMEAFSSSVDAVKADTTLDDAARQAKLEEVQEKAIKQLCELGKKTIRKNADNELGLTALQNIYYLLEPDELEALIAQLGPSNRENDFVKKLSSGIGSKKATAEGKMFTDFEIVQYPDAEDKGVVKFSDYIGKGKYMLVDFWASWCGPCKREIPNIKKVYEEFAGDNFDILSVAVWDEPQASIDTAAAYGIKWNQIVNAQKIPTDIYGIEGIPQLILFGPDGTILKRDLRGEEIAKEVSSRLGR